MDFPIDGGGVVTTHGTTYAATDWTQAELANAHPARPFRLRRPVSFRHRPLPVHRRSGGERLALSD